VGYSSNPLNRLNQHNSNFKDKYTGRASDWVLKSTFQVQNEAAAIQLERFIKKQKSMLSNPRYAAGCKAGAKIKKAALIIALASIGPLTLLLMIAILISDYSGGSGWL
jgi:hypothetical protein